MSTLSFLHLSDSHLSTSPSAQVNATNTYAALERAIAAIRALPHRPDFVIHTGDVANNCELEGYRMAAQLFSAIDVPCYFVAGNHDSAELMHQNLKFGDLEGLRVAGGLSYSFTCKGQRCLVLGAESGPDTFPGGAMPQSEIERLTRELRDARAPMLIFLHYPCLPVGSPWIDSRGMLLRNGAKVHEILTQYSQKIAGVFYGHIHHSLYQLVDGVFYVSVPSVSFQFGCLASDDKPRLEPEAIGGMNWVEVDGGAVQVRGIPLVS